MFRGYRTASIVFALSAVLAAGALSASDRIALVVGCNAYEHVPKLKNATADARAISGLLERAEFDVIELLDPGVEEIYEGLEKFKERSQSKEVGIVYFAGHGMEIE
ncbi:MAG: caspase family protein, partial [Verrucomicrobiota bacterium]